MVRVSSNKEIFESIGLHGVFETVKTETETGRGRQKDSEGPHWNLELDLCFGDTPRFRPLIRTSHAPSATQQSATLKELGLSSRCRSCYGPSFDVVLMAVEVMTETTERECWNGRSVK